MTASISKLTDSSAAYHCRGRETAYSLLDEMPTSFWFGRGADEIGLSGSVGEKEFRHLLQGFSPDGEKKLVQNAGDDDRQRGTEITLSVPGTLAALFAASGIIGKTQIARIIVEAAKDTITAVESELSYSRRGSKGELVEAVDGLIVACFLDLDSRNHQSMPHVHCCVINAALRNDGTHGTLESKPLYVAQKLIGHMFHEILGHLLEQELGLHLRRSNASFEVDGVPASVFPTLVGSRRQEILAALSPDETSNAKAAERAARMTRSQKKRVPHQELFKCWEELRLTVGFTETEAERLFHRQTQEEKQALSSDTNELKHEAYKRIIVTAQETVSADREVEPNRETNGDKQEQKTAINDRDSKSASRHGVPKDVADHVLCRSKWKFLSAEQRDAVQKLTVGGESIMILEALTGTGKDQVISAASEIWKKSGHSVLVTAPDSRSSQAMTANTGLDAKPLGRVLANLETTRFKNLFHHLRQLARAAIAKPTWGLQRTKLGPTSILVVDEASLVSQSRLDKVISECEARQAKLILVSDPTLRRAAGKKTDFQEMVWEGARKATLSRIQRQKNPLERQALEEIRLDGLKETLGKLFQAGRITSSSDPQRDALSAWMVYGIRSPKEHVLVADTREAARELNRRAQATRRASGVCSFPFLWVDPSNPWQRSNRMSARIGRMLSDNLGMTRFRPASQLRIYQGDRIVCTADYPLKGMRAGMTGTVKRIKLGRHPKITVKFDDGSKVTVYRSTYRSFQLAYAFAAEDLRGRTVAHAYVPLTHENPLVTYFQISRGSEANHVFASPKVLGEEPKREQAHNSEEHSRNQAQRR